MANHPGAHSISPWSLSWEGRCPWKNTDSCGLQTSREGWGRGKGSWGRGSKAHSCLCVFPWKGWQKPEAQLPTEVSARPEGHCHNRRALSPDIRNGLDGSLNQLPRFSVRRLNMKLPWLLSEDSRLGQLGCWAGICSEGSYEGLLCGGMGVLDKETLWCESTVVRMQHFPCVKAVGVTENKNSTLRHKETDTETDRHGTVNQILLSTF